MTNIGTIILLIVCVGVGYVLEPVIFGLRQEKKKQVVETKAKKPVSPKPEVAKPVLPPVPQVDLTQVKPEDFPAEVQLKESIFITEGKSGMTMELKEGTAVKPLRIEGNYLAYETIGIPLQSKIPIDQTNFKELVAPIMAKRMEDEAARKYAESLPPPPPIMLDEADILDMIKSEVEAGKVTEFKADQVTSWAVGEDREFDGETYQAGLVSFEANTILGVQEHKAVALIKQGKVAKWIWAKTGLEMR